MVKLSFGLSTGNKDLKDGLKLNKKLNTVFSESTENSQETSKKKSISEFSYSTSSNDNKNEEELNTYVIPCKNSLKDLKTEPKPEENVKKVKTELKFGLNVLFENDSKSEEPTAKASEPSEASLQRPVSEQNSQKDASPDHSDPSTDPADKDSEVAKKIISDLEKKRLREELFGSQAELIDRCSNTTPILLRGKENFNSEQNPQEQDGKSQKDSDLDIKSLLNVQMDQYQNVPVENFGLAMLLGMGYDPKKNNNKPKVYKKRVYDRAGLGADSVMKTNMDCLMDANLMSKLKKNHVYNVSQGTATTQNWALPGILVKVTDKDHELYKQKGVVKSTNNNLVNLSFQGREFQIHFKHLETVVSDRSNLCKVVRPVQNTNKQFLQVGTLVKLLSLSDESATVLYEDQEIPVSLDSISQFAN